MGTLSWSFPSSLVPDGNYMITLLAYEDEFARFPKGNQGRASLLSIEGVVRDILNPFGEIGFVQAAFDYKYCVSVSGGLDITLQNVPGFTGSQILSGIKVTADPQKKCSHSIYNRLDTWYQV